jgi:hypothetical protein
MGRWQAVAWNEHRVTLHEGATGKELRRWDNIQNACLAFTQDGKRLAVGSRTICIWELPCGEEVATFRGGEGSLRSISFSRDGRTLASVTEDGGLSLWEVATGQERCSVAGRFTVAAFSPDGGLLVAGEQSGVVILYEPMTLRKLRRLRGHTAAITALAFSPNSRLLASASQDTTALVWEGTSPPSSRQEVQVLSPRALEGLWADLAATDAARAYQASVVLLSVPRQTVGFLAGKVRPVVIDRGQVNRWVRDLDDDNYRAREQASAELGSIGRLAGPLLREALDRKPSVEASRRLERALAAMTSPTPAPQVLRSLRAIEVLEHLGTPEARKVLEALAGGEWDALATHAAAEALARLGSHAHHP